MSSVAEKMREYGIQSKIARRTKIARSLVCEIFNGTRRCTAKSAAKMEAEFAMREIPINRWDLLYGVEDGQKLIDYVSLKVKKGE